MEELKNEYEIIRLIYLKNYNQHRSQVWWKWYSILYRRLGQLTSQKKLDLELCRFLVVKFIPRAYRAFHNVLAQGAFVTLGFAALASLAKVWAILEPLVPRVPPLVPVPIRTQPEIVLEEDFGEAIEDDFVSVDEMQTLDKPDKPHKPHKPDKQTDNATKSDIDDIFSSKASKTKEHKARPSKPSNAKSIDMFTAGSNVSKTKNKTKTKTKTKNAIDDIFGTKKSKKKRNAIDDIFAK